MRATSHNTVNKVMLWIFYGLMSLTLLTPFLVNKDLLFPFVTTKAFFFRIVIELALPFYVYLLVAEPGNRPRLKNPLTILVVIFWLANLVSSLLGVNVVRSLWGNFERMGGTFYLLHLTLLYFYLLFLAQKSAKLFQDFLKLTVFISAALSLYSVLVALGMRPWVMDPSLPRVSAFFGNPIYLGSFLILPLTLTVWMGLGQDSGIKKSLYGLMALLQLAAIYLSGTRGAVLGLVLGALLALMFCVWFLKGRVKVWGIALTTLAFLLFIGIFAFGSRLSHVTETFRVFDLRDSNAQSRLLQWGTAIEGFKDSPVFGVGPENYYLIGNKYYNPAIAQYDRSWFDKPHNYVLEILLTDGSAGLLVFLALILASLAAVFLAYKKRLLSLTELFVLLAGLLAYHIQNLFVFENVSSSLVFFVMLAFTAYLWMEVFPQSPSPSVSAEQRNLSLAFAAALVTLCVSAYALYAGNFVPMTISKDVNYGYAYTSINPQKAYDYFHQAATLPFNFDLGELGVRYVNFSVGWLRSSVAANVSPQPAAAALDEATGVMERLVAQQPNYPIFLIQLANAYLFRGLENNGQIDPQAVSVIQRAINLAPNRTEARQFLIQIRELQKNWPDALALAKLNYQLLPRDSKMLWQVALLTNQNKDEAQAALLAERALTQGYKFTSFSEVSWLADYYVKNQNYQKAIALYQQAASANLLSQNDFLNLLKLYLQSGQTQAARNLAQAVGLNDPGLQAQMEILLKTVK